MSERYKTRDHRRGEADSENLARKQAFPRHAFALTSRHLLKSLNVSCSGRQHEEFQPVPTDCHDNRTQKAFFYCFFHTFGLLLLCLGSSGLELSPSISQEVLSINSSFSITCSGWNNVTWSFKRDEKVPEFHVEKPSSSSSVLRLEQVTWRHTGVYVCSEKGADETREVAVFVPAPEALDPYINASKTVLKQGETLNVNCTVHGAELVYFSWDFPHKEVGDIEPLTDILSSMSMRSFLNITDVSVDRSGQYVCYVQEGVQNQRASASINITVLEKGFVALSSHLGRNVSAQLGENVELKVEIEAYPKPSVQWTKDGAAIRGHSTRQEQETGFVSTLTLVRIRLEQMGLYTVTVQNQDDIKEMSFDLEVKVPPQITELSDHQLPGKKHAVTCVAEGVPSPSIQWFSCDHMPKCSNRSVAWSPLVEDPEKVTIQTNVSYNITRKIHQVHSQVTLLRPQLLTIRCEARNERGARARDIRLVNSTLFSQVAVLAAVLALVVIAIISIIILIAVWRKKPRYEIRWKVIESVSLDGHEYIYVDPIHLPYDLAWEMPRDSLVLGYVSVLCRYVSFGSECDGGYMDMTKDEQTEYVPMQELSDSIEYADIQPSPYESPYQQDIYQEQGTSQRGHQSSCISDSPSLSYTDLVGFSYQVAKGMEFLASKNIMAIARGTPYPDLPMNELFYSALKRGYRMAKPSYASDDIYEVMRKCWDEKFEKRPEFSFLVHTLGDMLSDGYKK
ncbi:hypothetical protein cypCar_00030481 [Cyprinus carpio]|nr:hypothetical protein cypCar_00030481 [Cyprinus carpio]